VQFVHLQDVDVQVVFARQLLTVGPVVHLLEPCERTLEVRLHGAVAPNQCRFKFLAKHFTPPVVLQCKPYQGVFIQKFEKVLRVGESLWLLINLDLSEFEE